jgi:superfamily II DNA or RNA helicase
MIQLRNYQIDAIEKIRENFAKGAKRLILCATTGAGKTVIFSEIARLTLQKNKTVLIITDRIELLKQSGNKLVEFGLMPNFLKADSKNIEIGNLYVAMVETLKRRISRIDYIEFLQLFDLIIIDEAHKNSFNRIFEYLKENQYVIGATATPYRSGKMPELKNFYDKIIEVITTKQLINEKYLSSPIYYGVPIDLKSVRIKGGEFDDGDVDKLYSEEKIYSGVVENLQKHALNEKTLIFAQTINSSQNLCSELVKSGFNAKHFDCYMNKSERNEILSWYANESNAVLTNVGILTTGFDSPETQSIVLYRPTKSLPLYLQMIGRGSRATQTKSEFKIFDFGNNLSRFGFWEDERMWTLENDKKPKRQEKGVSPVKNCPKCEALLFANQLVCKYCGYEYPQEKKERDRIFTILERLTPSETHRFAETCNIVELEEIRKIKGYKVAWVLHKLKNFKEFLEYENLKGYRSGWAIINYKIFKK